MVLLFIHSQAVFSQIHAFHIFDIKNCVSGNNVNVDYIDIAICSARCALLEYAFNIFSEKILILPWQVTSFVFSEYS